jgi:sortase A
VSGVRSWFAHLLEWLLLGFGIGCLAMFAYETVEARRFQAEQAASFEQQAEEPHVPRAVAPGELIGMLDVPRLKLSTPVVEGDDLRTLQRAVGHLPDTPMPWDQGNSAVAGHRDGLFRPLKDIEVGDEIRFRTAREELRYRVTRTTIVKPDDLSVLEPQSQTPTLTLVTCYPFYYVGTAPRRFIVHAERVSVGAADGQ